MKTRNTKAISIFILILKNFNKVHDNDIYVSRKVKKINSWKKAPILKFNTSFSAREWNVIFTQILLQFPLLKQQLNVQFFREYEISDYFSSLKKRS